MQRVNLTAPKVASFYPIEIAETWFSRPAGQSRNRAGTSEQFENASCRVHPPPDPETKTAALREQGGGEDQNTATAAYLRAHAPAREARIYPAPDGVEVVAATGRELGCFRDVDAARAAITGAHLAHAAQAARDGHRLIFLAVPHLGEAGADLEPAEEEIAELLDDADAFAETLLQIADEYGHAAVAALTARRAAS